MSEHPWRGGGCPAHYSIGYKDTMTVDDMNATVRYFHKNIKHISGDRVWQVYNTTPIPMREAMEVASELESKECVVEVTRVQ